MTDPQIIQITQIQDQDPQTFSIIGAAMDVHKTLGCGFLEAVYHKALMVEFGLRKIPFQHEVELPVRYKGIILDIGYRPDFLCFDEVIVEIKALSALGGMEHAQILNYLKASSYRRGLLLNFGERSLVYKRFVL
jgi:GxxExxY protein